MILDTSIYRELGFKFNENIDYQNLCNFTMNTDGEVLLSNIVIEEFTNFYKESLKTKTNSYLKSTNDLKRDAFFKSPQLNSDDVEREFKKAIEKFRKTLSIEPVKKHRIAVLQPTQIDGLELTKFILESRESKESNIQIRDYLIWDSILNFAFLESEERIIKSGRRKIKFNKSIVTFITKDKGFEENVLFQRLQENYGVDNVKVEKSILNFLHKKGFNFNFITSELLLQKIKKERILKDLSKDIGALLSYVSGRYSSNCYEKKVEKSEIEKVEVIEYYTYKDSEDDKYKFIAHLKVFPNVVYEADEEGYNESLEINKEKTYLGNLETYDSEKRPYFKEPILFMYGGLVNIERETIRSIRFIDFLPWMYI